MKAARKKTFEATWAGIGIMQKWMRRMCSSVSLHDAVVSQCIATILAVSKSSQDDPSPRASSPKSLHQQVCAAPTNVGDEIISCAPFNGIAMHASQEEPALCGPSKMRESIQPILNACHSCPTAAPLRHDDVSRRKIIIPAAAEPVPSPSLLSKP
jgi:hypothetical protein